MEKIKTKKIKTLILRIVLISLLVFSFYFIKGIGTINAAEKNQITIRVFNKIGCPHCEDEEEYLTKVLEDYDNISVVYYTTNDTNTGKAQIAKLYYSDLAKIFEVENDIGTPFTIIGGKCFIGFSNSQRFLINKYIEKYTNNDYVDIFAKYLSLRNQGISNPTRSDFNETDFDNSIDYEQEIPIIGRFNVKDVSLFLVSMVMGFVDGVNPCAMWVLLFLISMLIPTNDKKKIWILGGTFLLTSGIFYFCLLMSWITVIKAVSSSTILLTIVGIFAIIAGGYNLFKYFKARIKKEDGCDVTDAKQKKKITTKIKEIITKDNLWLAIIGIIGIAIIVNLIELACSAGMPVLFSDIIAINKVETSMVVVYSLIYVLFFLIDDFIVFFIAALSLKIKGVSNKITKYSHLIGGIIMLILGILMVFFPSIVMLNF